MTKKTSARYSPEVVADAILDCSKRGGIVLDPFAGSGTTLIAAEKTGRRGYGSELDQRYCDVIVRRMAHAFKVEAIHAATGKPFAEVEQERAAATAVNSQPDREVNAAEEVA